MTRFRMTVLAAAILAATSTGLALAQATKPAVATAAPDKSTYSKSTADILEASPAADWRALDPQNTYYLQLPRGRVVFELAPAYAPLHADNIRTLAREKYFDGLAVIRAQDNYVVQWGDPEEDEAKAKSLGTAKAELAPEFTVPISESTHFSPLPDADGYAPEVGFADGFPAGRDPKSGQTWLTHCYGAVGVARGNEPTSGNGSGLYVIIGHAPRHLDRNIAVVGRVVSGIELLSDMPRGAAPMGFYEKPEQRVAITSVRLAADVPSAAQEKLEVLRTDSPTFAAVAEARRNRHDAWYIAPAGYIELCNVPIPVRPVKD